MHWSSGARAHLQYYIIQLLTSIGLEMWRPFLIISPREVVLVSLFVCDRFCGLCDELEIRKLTLTQELFMMIIIII